MSAIQSAAASQASGGGFSETGSQPGGQNVNIVFYVTPNWVEHGGELDAWFFCEGYAQPRRVTVPGDEFTGVQATSTIILSGEYVNSFSSVIPRNFLRRHRNLLPSLFEDVLLGAADDSFHAATATPGSSPQLEVQLVERKLLSEILQRFAAASIQPVAMYCESALLGAVSQDAGVLVTRNVTVARRGKSHIVTETASEWFAILAKYYNDKAIRVFVDSQELADQAQGYFAGASVEVATGGVMQYLASSAIAKAWLSEPVNLLQGDYAPPAKIPWGRYAKWTAGSVALICMMAALYFVALTENLRDTNSLLKSEILEAAQHHVPQVRRPDQIKQAVSDKINASKELVDHSVSFSEFMAIFTRSWSQAGLSEQTVTNLRFSGGDGVVTMEINGITVAEAEALQSSLNTMGLASKLLSVNASTQSPGSSLVRLKVEARL